jgi:butyryl-CoA dehydrogenase
MGALADLIMEVYAVESAVIRAEKIATLQGEAAAAPAIALARLCLAQSIERIESSAKKTLAAVAEGDMLRTYAMILRRLLKHEPVNTIALEREIAERLLETGKYGVSKPYGHTAEAA